MGNTTLDFIFTNNRKVLTLFKEKNITNRQENNASYNVSSLIEVMHIVKIVYISKQNGVM